jgi:putative membrane protein
MMGGRGFEGYGERQFGFGGGPMFGAFAGIGMLIRLVIFGGLLFFVFSLFRRRSQRMHDEMSGPADFSALSPMDILRRRYAAGEITREQFEEMRRTLETSPSP